MTAPKSRKQPRQTRSRILVARILDATARILADKGYAGLNTNAVAAEARASIGSLYQYFPNKDALVVGVVERHGRQVYETIVAESDAQPPASLDAAIRGIVTAVVAAHRIDPVLHGVLEAEMPRLRVFDGHAATVAAIAERLDSIPGVIAADLVIGDFGQAAAVVGEMIHALVHSVLIPPITSRLTAAELEAETVRAVIAYLTSGENRADAMETGHLHH